MVINEGSGWSSLSLYCFSLPLPMPSAAPGTMEIKSLDPAWRLLPHRGKRKPKAKWTRFVGCGEKEQHHHGRDCGRGLDLDLDLDLDL
jgi:hypothetical protein